jgi:hypothetical protein
MAEDTSGTDQDETVSANFQVLRSIREKVAHDQALGIEAAETRVALYTIVEVGLKEIGPVPGRWDAWADSYVRRCRANGWGDELILRLAVDDDEDEDPEIAAAGRAMIRAALERALARG